VLVVPRLRDLRQVGYHVVAEQGEQGLEVAPHAHALVGDFDGCGKGQEVQVMDARPDQRACHAEVPGIVRLLLHGLEQRPQGHCQPLQHHGICGEECGDLAEDGDALDVLFNPTPAHRRRPALSSQVALYLDRGDGRLASLGVARALEDHLGAIFQYLFELLVGCAVQVRVYRVVLSQRAVKKRKRVARKVSFLEEVRKLDSE
jgi:hypothetical protein